MAERLLVQKIKDDIEKKSEDLKTELNKIKQQEDILDYIKGIIDITQENVLNFPYYEDNEQDEGKDNFETMLNYTLKDKKSIEDFKSQIKNLYFLDKVGYSNTKQYEVAKNSLEKYRNTIIKEYENLVNSNTIKREIEQKEVIMKKLDRTRNELEKSVLEIEDIDEFYDGLKYADISASDQTSILYMIFENNLQAILRTLKELTEVEQEQQAKKDNDDKHQNRFIIYQEIEKI